MTLLCNHSVLILLCFTSIEAFFVRDNVNCLLTAWSQWSEPNSSGEQTRSRQIMRYPSGRGRPCEELNEIKVFEVDCEVSVWTQWSDNFGFGEQSRTRTITQPSRGAGGKCPELEEVRYTGVVPSVKVTTKNVKNYFVRADRKYRKDNQIGKVETPNEKGLTRDLVIIMDSSGSINRGPFQDAKIQTSKLIGLLRPPDKPFDKVAGQPYQYNQAAMLTYSNIVEETFDFKRYNTTSDIQNAISRATYFDKSTNTAEAFRRAKGLFTTAKGARDPTRAKRDVHILTHAKSDNAAKTFAAAESLQPVADMHGLMTGSFTSDRISQTLHTPKDRISQMLHTQNEVSVWTQWSDNFGFGQQSRTRTITQPSIGAGWKTPELEEVRYTGIVPSVEATAKNFENYFVRADRKYRKDNQIGKVETPNEKGLTRDLVIIMDSSGSIRNGPFQDAKIQASKLIGLLCPSDKPFDKVVGQPYQYNQAAMLTYSHIVEETFDFKRYNTTSDIQNAISKATFFDSGTNTAEAFRRAKGLFTTAKGARDPARAKREVLILTDGQSDNAANTFAAVESLKRVADVYGLMTGSFSSGGMKELTKYVSAPINEHLFYVQNYQVQGKLVAYIQDSKKALGPKWCATFDI